MINKTLPHLILLTLLLFTAPFLCMAQKNMIRLNNNNGELTIYQNATIYNVKDSGKIEIIKDILQKNLEEDKKEINKVMKSLDTSNVMMRKQFQGLSSQLKRANNILEDVEKLDRKNSEDLQEIIVRSLNLEENIKQLNVTVEEGFSISHYNEQLILRGIELMEVNNERRSVTILGKFIDTCHKCIAYLDGTQHVSLWGIQASAGLSHLFLDQGVNTFPTFAYRAGLLYKYAAPTNEDWNLIIGGSCGKQKFSTGIKKDTSIVTMEEMSLSSLQLYIGNEWHAGFGSTRSGFTFPLYAIATFNLRHQYVNYLLDYYERGFSNVRRVQLGIGLGTHYQFLVNHSGVMSIGLNGSGLLTNLYKNKGRIYPMDIAGKPVTSIVTSLEFTLTFLPLWL